MTDLTNGRGRGIRPLAALAAVSALGVVALLTLAPGWIVGPARSAFLTAADDLVTPLLEWLPYADTERLLNTVMFVPLGVTVALLLSRRAWPLAVVAGFALSAAVEYLQGAIPGRVPDPADIVWNTAGTVIGVVLVTVPRVLVAAVRRADQRGSVTRT